MTFLRFLARSPSTNAYGETGRRIRGALQGDYGGVLIGSRPHGAGGRHDVVKVLPHVPRLDGPAPPREYSRLSAQISGGGVGNVCHGLKGQADFLQPFSETRRFCQCNGFASSLPVDQSCRNAMSFPTHGRKDEPFDNFTT